MKCGFILAISFLSLVLLNSQNSKVLADSWRMPKQEKYCSPNKKFCLEVTPKKLESQLKYFQDKVNQQPNAGADKEAKENFCKGSFLARNGLGLYSTKASFLLVNEVAPVGAIVANDGNFFVTFDNWHAVGYGDDVVSIYQSTGKLVKKLALEDIFTENDVETFSRSASSRHWGHGHYINESKGLLVLRAFTNGYYFNDNKGEFREVKINLATGDLVDGKKDRLPRYDYRVTPRNREDLPKTTSSNSPAPWRCAQDDFAIQSINLANLKEAEPSIDKPSPKYPPIAKVALITGTVVTELLIAENGDVLCARVTDGHPLLREVTVNACLIWKFPISSEKRLNHVSFDFQRVFIDPLAATNNRP